MVKGANTINQYKILKWINQSFYNENDGGVKTELVDKDVVNITDRDGNSMKISINGNNQIIDYDTQEVLEQDIDDIVSAAIEQELNNVELLNQTEIDLEM